MCVYIICRHAAADGIGMPRDPALVAQYLKDRHLDGNWYDQIIKRNIGTEKLTAEQLKQWKRRRGKFYLGDAGTNGKEQHWCPKWGAKQLSTGYRFYIDVSYKSTARIAGLKQPWGGVLHILVGYKNEKDEWAPHTTPCATILMEKAHPSGQEFLDTLGNLRRLCQREYEIDIINDTERTELITMGDMEIGLRDAVETLWKKSTKKICAFHFAQALLKKQRSTEIGLHLYFEEDNGRIYYYFRNFFMLWAVPPALVRRCYEILVKKRDDPKFGFYDVCEEEGSQWIKYFRDYYMKPKFVEEWNHWWSLVRTNNELENVNGWVNKMFGSHPYINRFAFRLAKWYQQEYVELQQFINNGYQKKRRKREVLKNNLLKRCWNWLDKLGGGTEDWTKVTNDQLITFLKYTSVACKADNEKLEEILNRRRFWEK